MKRLTALFAAGLAGLSATAPAASLEALEHGFDGLVAYYTAPHVLTATNALLISIKLQPGIVDGDPLGLAAYFASLSSCSGGAHDQFELHALYPQFADYIKAHAGGVTSTFYVEASGELGAYDFQNLSYPLNLGGGYAVHETLVANEGRVIRSSAEIGAQSGTWRSEGVQPPATALPYFKAYLDDGVSSPCALEVPRQDRNPQGQRPALLPEDVYFDKTLTVRNWPMPVDQAKRLLDQVQAHSPPFSQQTGQLLVRARATMTGIGPNPKPSAYGPPQPPVLYATIDPVLAICGKDDLDCNTPLAQYTPAVASTPSTQGTESSTASQLGSKAGQALFNLLSGKHQ